MPATIEHPKRKVQFLFSNWVNGNLTDVVDEILAMETADAATVTSLLIEQFSARGCRTDGPVFRRIMEGRRARVLSA